jgi:hypothetical protein
LDLEVATIVQCHRALAEGSGEPDCKGTLESDAERDPGLQWCPGPSASLEIAQPRDAQADPRRELRECPAPSASSRPHDPTEGRRDRDRFSVPGDDVAGA